MKDNRGPSLRKLGIKFGDNDFYNTFTVLTRSLREVYKHTEYLPKDKKKLHFIINQLSPVMYLLGQNCYEYNGMENIEDGLKTGENSKYLRTAKYLQIPISRIYVDEEVDEFLNDPNSPFNSDFHVLDLTQSEGHQIWTT